MMDPATTQQLLRQAAQTVAALNDRIERLLREQRAPIAVVGMACRLPGGSHDVEAFAMALHDGVDGIVPLPEDRWDRGAFFRLLAPDRDGEILGGFLPEVDGFEPSAFGISEREAASMDPQQRLFLEVATEALENAGIVPSSLAGSRTGVFVGMHNQSSDAFVAAALSPARVGPYSATGTAHNALAGRVSYLHDFRGPSFVVDTACSSSLVATHLACQSLRRRETSLAIVGGVNLRLLPLFNIVTSAMGTWPADGRCKSFDARADGVISGEGCGVVVLQRLDDAVAAGHPIWAVLRGSAVNQDGASLGLTAPNVSAQVDVLRTALEDAGVAPDDVGFVEAHGTGTPLGDPIELEALGEVFGGRRSDRPCRVGSVKSNFGHLEGAAGIAGLIKTVLAVQRGEIPPNLHFQELNPQASLDGTPLVVPTAPTPWPSPRVAGVSSFGWSGTNAHVVVTEAPAAAASPAWPGPFVLPLSARTPAALTAVIARMIAVLAEDRIPTEELCATAALGREHHRVRILVWGRSRAALRVALEDRAARAPVAPVAPAAPVFVFSGQGGQWPGMGRDLFDHEPRFREVFFACDAYAQELGAPSLIAGLAAESPRTDLSQPLLVALHLALDALWADRNVRPAAVIGHSLGEISAACVAGVLTHREAIEVAVIRGRLMQAAGASGDLAAIEASEAELRAILDLHPDLDLAAMNAPSAVVLAGPVETLAAAVDAAKRDGRRAHRLGVGYPFHGRAYSGTARLFAEALRALRPRAPRLPLYSTVTGRAGGSLEHWAAGLHAPVRFADAVATAIDAGHSFFLEIGPHPALAPAIEACAAARGGACTTAATLRRGRDGCDQILDALAQAYARGASPRWAVPAGTRRARLPSYPWQRTIFPRDPGVASRLLGVEAAPELPQRVAWSPWTPPPRRADAERWVVVASPETHAGPIGVLLRSLPAESLASASDIEGARLVVATPAEGDDASCMTEAALASFLALARGFGTARPRSVHVIAMGAEGVLPADPVSRPSAAAQLGLWRGFSAERLDIPVTTIDLPEAPLGASDLAALGACLAADGSHRLGVRAGQVWRPGLRPARPSRVGEPIRRDRSYLVTGGLGGIGRSVAGWLAARGAAGVVLLGRSAPNPSALRWMRELGSGGCRVVYRRADLAEPTALDRALASLPDDLPPVGGVFHLAGAVDPGLVEVQTPERLRALFDGKAGGAAQLDGRFGADIDFLVLFSSLVSWRAPAGTAGYVAANAYLDALAHRRRARGLVTCSIGWGPWAGPGMAAGMSTQGVSLIAPEFGLRVLEGALSGIDAVLLAAYDLSPDAATGPLAAGPAAVPASGATPEEVLSVLRACVARLLGVPPEGVEEETPLVQLGLDSFLAVELRRQVQERLGVDLALSEYLARSGLRELSRALVAARSAHDSRASTSTIPLQETPSV